MARGGCRERISPASDYGGAVAGRLAYELEHRLGGVLVPFPCPTQHGRVGYDLSSTERPHGTSAAKNALCACQATATVLHACAGKEMATWSSLDVRAAPNGVMPQCVPLSAVTVVLPPRDTPAQAGQGATDARKAPSARAGCCSRGRAMRNVPESTVDA